MRWDYYMSVCSGRYFRCGDGALPETVHAACFGTGLPCPSGYDGGLNMGTYTVGRGAVTVNTFDLLHTIGKNPAADRMLLNMLDAEYALL